TRNAPRCGPIGLVRDPPSRTLVRARAALAAVLGMSAEDIRVGRESVGEYTCPCPSPVRPRSSQARPPGQLRNALAPATGSSGRLQSETATRRRSHLQVQVRNGNACLEWLPTAFPFAEGPRVRIRLTPAASLSQ